MSTGTPPNSPGEHLRAFGALLERSGKLIESEIRGTSMGSALPAGSRIRIHPIPADEYRAGQVIAFISGHTLFAHRIVCRNRQGLVTRGDARRLCDLPVRFECVLGVVGEHLVDGEWRPLPDVISSGGKRLGRNAIAETIVRACMQIDIRLARSVARELLRAARWRRLVRESFETG